ncbi:hypothetical protein MMC25_003451 [Agyrium rufum]|nr:hypothetical protein [Agyrium rufum]
MAQQPRRATKFLVPSDTHDPEENTASGKDLPFLVPSTKVDVLLHCGDLTQVGGISSFRRAVKLLGKFDAELKLVIASTHDLELDGTYWNTLREEDGNPEDLQDHTLAVEAIRGPFAQEAGVTFLDEGTHTFTLKSAVTFTIYVSPYTPAFGDWAFAYKHDEDRFNGPQHTREGAVSIATDPISNNVDIVMTHGPSKGILDKCPQGDVGCDHLLQAIRRVSPLMHCFGHIHEGNGAQVINWGRPDISKSVSIEREDTSRVSLIAPLKNPYPQPYIWRGTHGNQTLAVNAAIMTEDNKPEQLPWLVSLELPILQQKRRERAIVVGR